MNELSGHTQVLLLANVKFPVQFWHILVELQVKQFGTLQVTQFPEKRVVPDWQTQFPLDSVNSPVHPQAVKTRFPTHCWQTFGEEQY